MVDSEQEEEALLFGILTLNLSGSIVTNHSHAIQTVPKTSLTSDYALFPLHCQGCGKNWAKFME